MTSNDRDGGRWDELDPILEHAFDLTGEARERYLDEAVGDDRELRAEVESLLAADALSRGPLDGRIEDLVSTLFDGRSAARGSPIDLSGRHLGSYTLVRRLGAGGMGIVYEARDAKLDRRVALKLLAAGPDGAAERRAAVEREAKQLARLNHPGIVTVHSVEEADGVAFLTMELVEGRSLDELIPADGLSVDAWADLASQLAIAIAVAHDRGLVHRDLKPANVMLTDDGRIKVLDFGLAELGAAEAAATDGPSPLQGTVPYLSPEQIRGGAVDLRSDLFSLGTMLYEMACGHRPFRGESSSAVIESIMRDDPVDVAEVRADLPSLLGRIVDRCLEKDPNDRYQSASELHDELQRLQNDLVPTRTVRFDESARPSARRRSQGRWLVAALAILVVTVAAWWTWRAGETAGSVPDPGEAVTIARSLGVASLVALPATIVSSDAEQGYLADAVPTAISTRLVGMEGVETRTPPSNFDIEKLGGLDYDLLRRAFAVDAFVISSLAIDGALWVLDVQLVDATSREPLWRDEFTGSQTDFLDLVRRAAVGVREAVSPGSSPSSADGPTGSSAAQLELSRGQYYNGRWINLREERYFDLAFAAYEEALALDPKLARAASRIGALYIIKRELGDELAEKQMEAWAQRALTIDPDDGTALALLANLSWEFEDALRAYEADPSSPLVRQAIANTLPSDLLLLEANRRLSLDSPLLHPPKLNAAIRLLLLGRLDEALEFVEQALRLDPEMGYGLLFQVPILAELGRVAEAREILSVLERLAERGEIPSLLIGSLGWTLEVAEDDTAVPATTNDIAELLQDETVPSIVRELTFYVTVSGWSGPEDGERRDQLGIDPARWVYYDLLLAGERFAWIREQPDFAERTAEERAIFVAGMAEVREARSRGQIPTYLEAPMDEIDALLAEVEGEI